MESGIFGGPVDKWMPSHYRGCLTEVHLAPVHCRLPLGIPNIILRKYVLHRGSRIYVRGLRHTHRDKYLREIIVAPGCKSTRGYEN